MDTNQFETESKAVFARLPKLEPSPYLAGRILAVSREHQRTRTQLRWWRLVATVSVTAMICLAIGLRVQKKETTLLAFQPYVIHVTLDEAEVKLAASAEIELPEGVHFVSKDEEIKNLRRLKLPVGEMGEGRSRLPFVVSSDREGSMPLQVRIFNSQDQVIQTKTLTLHFVGRS